MNKKIIPLVVVLFVVVGAGAFYGGMKYQETKSPRLGQNRQFQMGGPGGFNRQMGGGNGNQIRMMNGGPVMGEIISQDDSSITIKMPDGSSKIVLLSDSVTVSKSETGSKSDLKVGTQVGVFGTTNQDGTVTAQSVQLNPMFRMMRLPNEATSSPAAQ